MSTTKRAKPAKTIWPKSRPALIPCAICGKMFRPRTHRNVLCSDPCREKHKRRTELVRYHREHKPSPRSFELMAMQEACAAPRRKLAEEPTTARPGSVAKVAVLAARALAGEMLWHPDDAMYEIED